MTPSDEIKTGDLVRWEYGEGPCAGPDNWVEGTLVAPGYLAKIEVSQCGLGTRTGRTMSFGTFDSAILRRITRVATPVGDIRVTADPTLNPVEFRIDTGVWSLPDDAKVTTVEWKREHLGEFMPPTAPVGTVRQLGGGAYEVMTKDGWRPHVGVDLGFGPADYTPACPPGADRAVFDNPNAVTISGPTLRNYRKPARAITVTNVEFTSPPPNALLNGRPVHIPQPTTRPDGFDQGRINAIKADMLAVGRRR